MTKRVQFQCGEINVVCTDLDRSLRFYRDVLGFELVERDGDATRLRLGDSYLLLLPIAQQPATSRPYGERATVSFDVVVDDLAAANQWFLNSGVEIERPYRPTAPSVIIRDPDGLIIEVIAAS